MISYMEEKILKRKILWKYFLRKGRFINFKNPKLFTEKIQWLKVYDCTPIKTRLADKILVRDWVKEQIGEQYLKKIIGVYEKYEDINFKGFPIEFVIKTNHGSKMQVLVLKAEFLSHFSKNSLTITSKSIIHTKAVTKCNTIRLNR